MSQRLTLDQATLALAAGQVVAIPTETVYGLAASLAHPQAIDQVFALKSRPANHPLILHVASFAQLSEHVTAIPEAARKLAAQYWPGPLTLVLPRASHVPDSVTGGQSTVAVRVPNHPLTLALLSRLESPLVAPSANQFTHVSPTTAEHVDQEFMGQVPVLDGGPCEVGLESTIIDLTGSTPRILRPGAITQNQIENTLGYAVHHGASDVRVPGQHAVHYAPKARVVVEPLDQALLQATEASHRGEKVALACTTAQAATTFPIWQLPANAHGYARALYATLRRADDMGLDAIYIARIHFTDQLDVAIQDRLRRAAGRG